jgi:hypothetical protein
MGLPTLGQRLNTEARWPVAFVNVAASHRAPRPGAIALAKRNDPSPVAELRPVDRCS